MEEKYTALIVGIADYFKKNNCEKALLGLSGGLDSTVAAYLTVKALGKENVMGVFMPDTVTSEESKKDAEEVANILNIELKTFEIDDLIDNFKELGKDELAIANTKARIRMCILYFLANEKKALVIGTSDKSELALGYTTKYGDSASDILVLGDLWKTDVRELGKLIKIPDQILGKKPGPELIQGMTAEKELAAPYKIIDKILKAYIEDDTSLKNIIKNGFEEKIVKNVLNRLRLNEHKRRNPILIKVSDRSFHNMEWRMPLTNKFKG